MDTLNARPANALQAKAFTSPSSLSFPGGVGDLTPPSENDANKQVNGSTQRNGTMNGSVNGQQQGQANATGTGVTPATPAATPGATQGVSGIVPTLQ